MPSSRSLVLGLIGAVVLICIVLLLLKVQESPATEVDEDRLKEARAAYQRAQGAAQRARPELPEVAPVLPPREPDQVDEPDQADDPPERDRPPERRVPPQIRLNPAAARLDQAQAVGMEGDGLKNKMDGVNKLYDRADYEGARDAAIEVLENNPKQVRMLRVVVSSSCIMGDHDIAAKYFDKLERARDRRQMARRCKRYGVELEE